MQRKYNKQQKLHIKVQDYVKIIAGEEKGKEGKVLSIDREKMRAIVEDRNLVKRHVKPSADKVNGEIIEKPAGIHISNLMVIDQSTGKARRTGRRFNEKGKLERYFKTHSSKK